MITVIRYIFTYNIAILRTVFVVGNGHDLLVAQPVAVYNLSMKKQACIIGAGSRIAAAARVWSMSWCF